MDPELSAVVLIGSERGRAQRTVDSLGRQRSAARIEILIVDTRPELGELVAPPGLRVQTHELPGGSLAAARALAVRRARSPIVAFIEDHADPDPGWAEAVIRAFAERPRAAVAYEFRNANPEGWVSRAGFMVDYVTWAEPLGSVPSRLPCNNCAYDRELLIARDDRLELLIVSDVVLHEDLRAAGHELHVEAGAIVYHENIESARDLFSANFQHTRMIAAKRVEVRGMGPLERFAYAIGALLLVAPLKLLRDLRSIAPRPSLWGRYAEAVPLALSVHAYASLGEAIGYLAAGEAEKKFLAAELDLARAGARRGP